MATLKSYMRKVKSWQKSLEKFEIAYRGQERESKVERLRKKVQKDFDNAKDYGAKLVSKGKATKQEVAYTAGSAFGSTFTRPKPQSSTGEQEVLSPSGGSTGKFLPSSAEDAQAQLAEFGDEVEDVTSSMGLPSGVLPAVAAVSAGVVGLWVVKKLVIG